MIGVGVGVGLRSALGLVLRVGKDGIGNEVRLGLGLERWHCLKKVRKARDVEM